MQVLAKFDANGYPYASVLVEYYDPEEHGPREDWAETTVEAVNLAAETFEPA